MTREKLLEMYAAGERNFRGIKLVNVDLRDVDLSGADFCEATFDEVNLFRANLWKANLWRAKFSLSLLSRAVLRFANLLEADLSGAILLKADLSKADLRGANLHEGLLRKAILNGANLRGANLFHAFLSDASLRYADLREANLSQADLIGADLTCADLEGADLSDSKLAKAFLSSANLSNANLSGATGIDTGLGAGTIMISNLQDVSLNATDPTGYDQTDAKMKFFEVIEDNDYTDALKYIICAKSLDQALQFLRERYINYLSGPDQEELIKITEPDKLKQHFWDCASYTIFQQEIPVQLGSFIEFDEDGMAGFFYIQDGVLHDYYTQDE